jgi:hypothetical protein
MMYVVYYPNPTPAFSNNFASSIKFERYPHGPGSAGYSSVPTFGLFSNPLNFFAYSTRLSNSSCLKPSV